MPPAVLSVLARLLHLLAVLCVQVLHVIAASAAAHSGVRVLNEQSASVLTLHASGEHDVSEEQSAVEYCARVEVKLTSTATRTQYT